ncbi:MAG: hypothetical protein V7717_01855 [Porticoccaceae bacterium]
MYTLENYQWGLVAYYIGALLIMVPVWRVTRVLPWFPVRWFFRVVFVAALLTPMIVYRDMDFLAPAWGVAVFEMIYPQTGEGWQRGVWPMVVVGCVLYALVLAIWLLIRRWRNKKLPAGEVPHKEPTLSEMMSEQGDVKQAGADI